MNNYYTVLEIPVGSEIAEIRESYRRLAQKSLFDKEAFAKLMEAYEVLSSPSRRREYDKQVLNAVSSTPQAAMDLQTVSDPNNILLFEASQKCPMGNESQCPIANARSPISDTFCPECGYQISDIPADGFDTGISVGISNLYRLEEETGRQYRLSPGINTVGRESGDVILPDKTISRDHADIHIRPEGTVFLEDKGSTNGTQINGERLAAHFPREIKNGDTVRFGSIRLRLSTPGEDGDDSEDADKLVVTASGMALVPSVVTEFVPEEERESHSVADMGLVPDLNMSFGLNLEPGLPPVNDPRNNSGMFMTGPAGLLSAIEDSARVSFETSPENSDGNLPSISQPSPFEQDNIGTPDLAPGGERKRSSKMAAGSSHPPVAPDFATTAQHDLPAPADVKTPTAAEATLTAVNGEIPEVYTLDSTSTTFGRRADNSIIIRNDLYVSGRHAQIVGNDGIFTITDLGSTNGTLLNGERMAANEPVILKTGDEIAVGSKIFRFEKLEASDAVSSEAESHHAITGSDLPTPGIEDDPGEISLL